MEDPTPTTTWEKYIHVRILTDTSAMVEIFCVQSITEGYRDEGWICPEQDYDQVGIFYFGLFLIQDSLS